MCLFKLRELLRSFIQMTYVTEISPQATSCFVSLMILTLTARTTSSNDSGSPIRQRLLTYSGNPPPPGPHGPDYIMAPLDFCNSSTSVLSSEICIVDFDQSFTANDPPPGHPGIPAKYLAPEVAVGGPLSPASDVWALVCAIFRIRTGEDLFFDFDTACPIAALNQIIKTLGRPPRAVDARQVR